MEELEQSPETTNPESRAIIIFPSIEGDGRYLARFEVHGDFDFDGAWKSYINCGRKVYYSSGSERALDHETVTFDTWLQHNHSIKHWLPDGDPAKKVGVRLEKGEGTSELGYLVYDFTAEDQATAV